MAIDVEQRTRARFTVDQYEQMARTGVLDEDYRVELIGGEIVEMAAIGERHAGAVKTGASVLFGRLSGRAVISVQDPLRLPLDDEPQPDLMALRPREDMYAKRHPGAEDVLLLIEVSDSTFRFDLHTKGAIYARHMIPDYWIVNLARGVLVVLRDPVDGRYGSEQVLRRGAAVAPLAFPDVEIAVVDLLPRV